MKNMRRLHEGFQVLHFLLGAGEERHTLVNLFRDNVKDALLTGGTHTAGLFGDEGHRRALVQEAKLTVRVLGVARVAVDASVQDGSVEVTDEGTDVTGAVRLGALFRAASLEGVHVLLQARSPHVVVAFVEGVNLTRFRNLDVVVGHDELADGRVEGEPYTPSPRVKTRMVEEEYMQ